MAESSDKPKDNSPRLYTVKEAFKRLDIGVTAGREWIVLYERLTAPLPRATDRPNGARLVSLEAIKTIRAARSIISQSGGGVTTEDAMRRVLGLDPLPVAERPTQPELTPQAFAAAVRTELEPLFERLSSLEGEVRTLRQELATARALPVPVQESEGKDQKPPDRQELVERVLESGQEVERHEQKPPRPNTFFNRLKNVFGRGDRS